MPSDNTFHFGYEFETKVLASILGDTSYLVQIGDILKSEYFTNEAIGWLVSLSLEYLRKYNSTPTLLFFKTETEKLDNTQTVLKESAIAALKDAVTQSHSDLSYVKDQTVVFCKEQEIKGAILKSVDLLKTANYEQIQGLIEKALMSGTSRDLGHDYKEDFEARYSTDRRVCIPTPWEIINDITGGGFGKKELTVVVAPPGAGKSWIICAAGAHAVALGYTVIHFTLELSKEETALRYDSIISGYSNGDLPLYKDKIKPLVDQLPGHLFIEEYPTKGASTLTLRAHLNRAAALDIKPELIIVDYGDLLKGTHKELRLELNEIYKDLRNIAGVYDAAVISPSQSQRSSISEQVIEGDQIAEDISKLATADLTFSLSRTKEDKLAGTGRVHIIKNRHGIDGLTFPATFNASNGKIAIFSNTSREGAEARQEMYKGPDLVRRELSRKYFDMTSNL